MEEFCECPERDCKNCLCKCYLCSLSYDDRMKQIKVWAEEEKQIKECFYPVYPLTKDDYY